jgi:tyrosine-protein kinase Etk/Wzc
VVAPDDVATEQLRALRTSLGFMLKARGNVVAMSSPFPGVGKSFVATNLAELFAAAGKRVLLVDADLRCGVVQERYDVQGPGLADVLLGTATIEDATKPTVTAKLDVVCSGGPVERPAELLSTPRLQETLAVVAERYDVVIVDTPPALAVTDPVLVARCASVNLLVLRARHHRVREVAFALERLEQGGAEVHGAILNEAETSEGYVYEHRSTGRRRSAARRPS